MIVFVARAALMAMALGAAAVPAAAPGAPTELSPAAREAAAVVDRFHDALRRADSVAAQSLLAERALIFEAGGVERGKAEYAAEHLGADAAYARAVPAAVTRRSGEALRSMAWIATEGRTTGIFTGKPIDQLTTETMVLRQAGGAWKIVHIHWSSGKASR